MGIFDGNGLKDYFECRDEVKGWAEAVGVICAEGQPIVRSGGLSPKSLQSYYSLAARPGYPDSVLGGKLHESIRDEPAVWMVGTAFCVDRRTALTAWHNIEFMREEIESSADAKLRLVIGFYAKSSPRSTAYAYEVLPVQRVERVGDTDVAIVHLAKAATATGLDLAKATEMRAVRNGDALEILGHPLGMRLKFAEGSVSDADPNRDRSDCQARLTAFSGNSGSPVFCKGKVVGVLTGGNWGSEFRADAMSGAASLATHGASQPNAQATIAYVSKDTLG